MGLHSLDPVAAGDGRCKPFYLEEYKVGKGKMKNRLSGVGIVNVLDAITEGGKSRVELSAVFDRMYPKPRISEHQGERRE